MDVFDKDNIEQFKLLREKENECEDDTTEKKDETKKKDESEKSTTTGKLHKITDVAFMPIRRRYLRI